MLKSPESMELIQLYHRGKIVGMPAPSALAIPIADAFVVLQQDDIRYDNAASEEERCDEKH